MGSIKRKENVYIGVVKDKGNNPKSQRNNYPVLANYGNISASGPDRIIVPRLLISCGRHDQIPLSY